MGVDDPGFQSLAAQAFEVMMKRGWSVSCYNGRFVAMRPATVSVGHRSAQGSRCVMEGDVDQGYRGDPFTALVEAERWMKEQEGKSGMVFLGEEP